MFLQNSQRKIEEEFLKLTEKLGADREPLKTICEKLDGCGRDLGLVWQRPQCADAYAGFLAECPGGRRVHQQSFHAGYAGEKSSPHAAPVGDIAHELSGPQNGTGKVCERI